MAYRERFPTEGGRGGLGAAPELEVTGSRLLGLRPRVSVVIPAYNAARYLPQAIDSVLAQTFRDYEVIVVDDGSTDDTPRVLSWYEDEVAVIRQPNQGRAAARNAGIAAARGEYIAFLDADDLWLPEKLERQLALFRRRPEIGWAYCDYRRLNEKGPEETTYLRRRGLQPPPEGWILPELLATGVAWTMTVVVRRECFGRVGLFDPSFPVAQDYDMWLRLAAEYEVGCVNEPLALYRRHPEQVTRSSEPGTIAYHNWRVLRRFTQEYYRRLPRRVRRQVADIARRRLAECACWVAQAALAAGDRRKARGWVLRAMLTNRQAPRWQLGMLLDTLLPTAVMRQLRRLRSSAPSGE